MSLLTQKSSSAGYRHMNIGGAAAAAAASFGARPTALYSVHAHGDAAPNSGCSTAWRSHTCHPSPARFVINWSTTLTLAGAVLRAVAGRRREDTGPEPPMASPALVIVVYGAGPRGAASSREPPSPAARTRSTATRAGRRGGPPRPPPLGPPRVRDAMRMNVCTVLARFSVLGKPTLPCLCPPQGTRELYARTLR
jgi:hypothetical protein